MPNIGSLPSPLAASPGALGPQTAPSPTSPGTSWTGHPHRKGSGSGGLSA